MESVVCQLICHASNRENIQFRTYLLLLHLWCHIGPFFLNDFPLIMQGGICSTFILHVCQLILTIAYKYIARSHFQMDNPFVQQHLISLGNLPQKDPYFLLRHELHLGYPPSNICFIAILHDDAVALLIEGFYLIVLDQILMMGKLDQFLYYRLDPFQTFILPKHQQLGHQFFIGTIDIVRSTNTPFSSACDYLLGKQIGGPLQFSHPHSFYALHRYYIYTTQAFLNILKTPLPPSLWPIWTTLINIYKLEFLLRQLSILNKVMISASQTLISCKNPRVNTLLMQIAQQKGNLECTLITKVKQDRKMYHSNSTKTSRNSFMHRPLFNNKTREGELLDMEFKPVPYLFVPGYKNETFIMPDRVFQKGKAGKRFFIKMKDTAICSFRQSQDERMSQVLHKKEKQQTIIGRQNEQFNKIINENDGKLKAQANKWFLKTRKRFDPAHGRQLFSECEHMLEPKDPQTTQTRKTSLSKTYDFRNKWRPATRGAQVFSATTSVSNYHHQHYASSVR